VAFERSKITESRLLTTVAAFGGAIKFELNFFGGSPVFAKQLILPKKTITNSITLWFIGALLNRYLIMDKDKRCVKIE
jgi:hypothetical protein